MKAVKVNEKVIFIVIVSLILLVLVQLYISASHAESFEDIELAPFHPSSDSPSDPSEILSRVNGLAPARLASSNRGNGVLCAGDNSILFDTACKSAPFDANAV